MNMIEFPVHLLHNEQNAIIAFATRLSEQLANNLTHLYLIGSKARGDFHFDSDIDLLVVVQQLQPDVRWFIRAAAADCSLQYDVLFNTHILDQARWRDIVQYRDTLWRETARDGIPIHVPEASSLIQ